MLILAGAADTKEAYGTRSRKN